MITIRCTHRLIKSSRVSVSADPPAPTAPLGEWYANILHLPFRGRSLVVFVHNPSRLVVAAPGRTLATAVPIFRERLPRLLERLGIPEAKIRRQEAAMQETAFARTVDRSLLGSMTDICHDIRFLAQQAGSPAAFDLDVVENNLAETPILVTKSFPDRMVRELLGARTLQ